MKRIGLIAGKTKYPLIFAEEAMRRDFFVVAIAIKDETMPEIEKLASQTYWIEIGELDKLLNIFKKEKIKQAVMAGGISKGLLFKKDIYLDKSMQEILNTIKDNKDVSILTAFAQRLKQGGIELMDSTTFLYEYLPEKGCLTRRSPTSSEWEDVKFGWDVAKEIASLDIGMTVVVKNKTVLALEAIEGTDETIKRGALLGNGEVVIVKVSRPHQDMRFDLPVIGEKTVEIMKETKGTVLAIEAKKTLFIDQKKAVEEADKSGISIVAL